MAKGRKTGGRKRGTPNKVSREVRAQLQALIEGNLPLANTWLQEVGWKEKPEIAARLFTQVLEFTSPRYARVDPLAEKAAEAEAAKATAGGKSADEMSDAELEALVRQSPEFAQALSGPNSAAEAGQLYDALRLAVPGSLQERLAGKALELTASAPRPAEEAAPRKGGKVAAAPSAPPRTSPTAAPTPVLKEPAPIALGGATLMPREPTAEQPTPRRERKPEVPRCSAFWLVPGEHRVVHPDKTVEIVTIDGGDAKWWQPPVEGAYIVDNTLQRSMGIGGGITLLPSAIAAPADGG